MKNDMKYGPSSIGTGPLDVETLETIRAFVKDNNILPAKDFRKALRKLSIFQGTNPSHYILDGSGRILENFHIIFSAGFVRENFNFPVEPDTTMKDVLFTELSSVSRICSLNKDIADNDILYFDSERRINHISRICETAKEIEESVIFDHIAIELRLAFRENDVYNGYATMTYHGPGLVSIVLNYDKTKTYPAKMQEKKFVTDCARKRVHIGDDIYILSYACYNVSKVRVTDIREHALSVKSKNSAVTRTEFHDTIVFFKDKKNVIAYLNKEIRDITKRTEKLIRKIERLIDRLLETKG